MDQWKKRSWQLCRKSLFPHTPMVCRVSSLFLEHRRRTTLFSHQLSSECHSLWFDKSMYQQILRVFSCKIKGAFNMKQSYITFIELNVLKTYEDNKKRERVNHIWMIFWMIQNACFPIQHLPGFFLIIIPCCLQWIWRQLARPSWGCPIRPSVPWCRQGRHYAAHHVLARLLQRVPSSRQR